MQNLNFDLTMNAHPPVLRPVSPASRPTRLHSARAGSLPVAVGLLVAVLLVSGCGSPTSRQPLGARPAPVEAAPLSGSWRDAEGKIWHVRVVNPSEGQLEVATVEQEEGKPFELQRYELRLRREDDVTLFNFRDADPLPTGEDTWLFGRWIATDSALVLFPASAPALRPGVLDGTWGGILKTNTQNGQESYEIEITGKYEALARALASQTGWSLLDTDHPWVFTRVTTPTPRTP